MRLLSLFSLICGLLGTALLAAACTSPPPLPFPNPDTAPNVLAHVTLSGPRPVIGPADANGLLFGAFLGVGLYHVDSNSGLPQATTTLHYGPGEQQGYLQHVKAGTYEARLFHWEPNPGGPVFIGDPQPALPDSPQAAVTVGKQDLAVDVELPAYNATGPGPHHNVRGLVTLTGNPPPFLPGLPRHMQLVFTQLNPRPGHPSQFVLDPFLASRDGSQSTFATDLSPGAYTLGFAGTGLRHRRSGDTQPLPLDVTGSIEGIELHLSNITGQRPADLGVITGELVLGDWDPSASRIAIRAVRREVPPGQPGGPYHDPYDDLHDEAIYQVLPEDVTAGRASFVLGWLNPGNYSIFTEGPIFRSLEQQIVISDSNLHVSGIVVE
jgi:hypothetical protein